MNGVDRTEQIYPEQTEVAGAEVVLLSHSLHQLLIRPDFTGFRYRAVAQEYAAKQMTALLVSETIQLGDSVLLVDIPRGGLPYGAGIDKSIKNWNGSKVQHLHANSGATKAHEQDLLPNTIEDTVSDLVITDGVIGLGVSIIEIMQHFAEKISPSWSGQVVIVTGSSAIEGIDAINAAFNKLQQAGLLTQAKLILAAGRVLNTDEHQGVKDNGGRPTIWLGEGDGGKKVQGSLTAAELRAAYSKGP